MIKVLPLFFAISHTISPLNPQLILQSEQYSGTKSLEALETVIAQGQSDRFAGLDGLKDLGCISTSGTVIQKLNDSCLMTEFPGLRLLDVDSEGRISFSVSAKEFEIKSNNKYLEDYSLPFDISAIPFKIKHVQLPFVSESILVELNSRDDIESLQYNPVATIMWLNTIDRKKNEYNFAGQYTSADNQIFVERYIKAQVFLYNQIEDGSLEKKYSHVTVNKLVSSFVDKFQDLDPKEVVRNIYVDINPDREPRWEKFLDTYVDDSKTQFLDDLIKNKLSSEELIYLQGLYKNGQALFLYADISEPLIHTIGSFTMKSTSIAGYSVHPYYAMYSSLEAMGESPWGELRSGVVIGKSAESLSWSKEEISNFPANFHTLHLSKNQLADFNLNWIKNHPTLSRIVADDDQLFRDSRNSTNCPVNGSNPIVREYCIKVLQGN